jgi:hypothetical protein
LLSCGCIISETRLVNVYSDKHQNPFVSGIAFAGRNGSKKDRNVGFRRQIGLFDLSDDNPQDTAEGDLLFAYDRYLIGLFQAVQLLSLASIEDCVYLGLHA